MISVGRRVSLGSSFPKQEWDLSSNRSVSFISNFFPHHTTLEQVDNPSSSRVSGPECPENDQGRDSDLDFVSEDSGASLERGQILALIFTALLLPHPRRAIRHDL